MSEDTSMSDEYPDKERRQNPSPDKEIEGITDRFVDAGWPDNFGLRKSDAGREKEIQDGVKQALGGAWKEQQASRPASAEITPEDKAVMQRYKEEYIALDFTSKKRCSWPEFERRLLENNGHYLHLSRGLLGEGALWFIDQEGNPVISINGKEEQNILPNTTDNEVTLEEACDKIYHQYDKDGIRMEQNGQPVPTGYEMLEGHQHGTSLDKDAVVHYGDIIQAWEYLEPDHRKKMFGHPCFAVKLHYEDSNKRPASTIGYVNSEKYKNAVEAFSYSERNSNNQKNVVMLPILKLRKTPTESAASPQ